MKSKSKKKKLHNIKYYKDKYNKFKTIVFIVSSLLIMSIITNILLGSFILEPEKEPEQQECITEEVTILPNIVMLGDSLTEVYDLEKFYPSNNYTIINSGYSGNTTEDVLKNLKKRALQYKPQKIFLLIGINDIGKSWDESRTIENIKTIIDEIKEESPKTKLYVESLFPVNYEEKDKDLGKKSNKKVLNINKEIEEYCLENDVIYIDVHDNLIDEDDNLIKEYTKDGLHLSEAGYDKITEILKPYIED